MSQQFTAGGIILVGVILWAVSQSASADLKHVINLFLLVLLSSMVLLNWGKISPLFFKQA